MNQKLDNTAFIRQFERDQIVKQMALSIQSIGQKNVSPLNKIS